MNEATIEAKMLRWLEIKRTQANLRDEKSLLEDSLLKACEEAGRTTHVVTIDENFEAHLLISSGRERVFNKEKMARDLKVSVSETNKKDFLINMAEKGKLTLETFRKYFSYTPITKISISKKVIPKARKKKDPAA